MAAKIPTLQLVSGAKMPVIGLGTWKVWPDVATTAVKTALTEGGYTHVDGAIVYGNEKEIGQAYHEVFSQGKVKREDVFITAKLWCTHHHLVRKGFNQTLADLQLDYLDLFLMHLPLAWEETENMLPEKPVSIDHDYLDTWKDMEKLVDEGLVKDIGVSNFNSSQLQRILDNCRIKPSVQQIESHVCMTNQPLIDWCQERDIVVTGYSPFASPDRPWRKNTEPAPLLNPEVKAIADRHGKSPAQVLLRHGYQRNLVVLVKSINLERMKQNLEIFDFELAPDEMSILNSMNINHRINPGMASWMDNKYFPW